MAVIRASNAAKQFCELIIQAFVVGLLICTDVCAWIDPVHNQCNVGFAHKSNGTIALLLIDHSDSLL